MMGQPSERLSDTQEKVLAILPIPSAILSIFGSSVILYIALKSRERRKWTPYTRLLIGLSICDIIASITIAISTFLRPSESPRAWSYGNDATCSAIGFLTQVSSSAACYNVMLSFYFLMTARFGLKNAYIAKRIEPLMHSISIGYFLGTAIIGAILGVYADTAVSLGCWVSFGCPVFRVPVLFFHWAHLTFVYHLSIFTLNKKRLTTTPAIVVMNLVRQVKIACLARLAGFSLAFHSC